MLKTKCILKPKEKSDDMRISIMPRHTLNDGVTPDLRIGKQSYDYHLTQFAPPLKLLGDYLKRGLLWEQFEKEYLEYLRLTKMGSHMQALISLATHSTATILCVEETPEYCYRRLLAEECKRLEPSLEIKIE